MYITTNRLSFLWLLKKAFICFLWRLQWLNWTLRIVGTWNLPILAFCLISNSIQNNYKQQSLTATKDLFLWLVDLEQEKFLWCVSQDNRIGVTTIKVKKQNPKNNCKPRMPWQPQWWRAQRNAIRNVNCRSPWIIKSLNAYGTSLWEVCLSERLYPLLASMNLFVQVADVRQFKAF